MSGKPKKLSGAENVRKFDEYALAKYNRDGAVKLRDVLFLCHAKPKDAVQEKVWKRLVNGELAIPDTWEVSLSTGKDKTATWERLLSEGKLGALALLRNLRNMKDAGVGEKAIFGALEKMKVERVLPFRFISAAKYAPQWEPQLEAAMLRCIEGIEKLPGKTVLLVDVSGSMWHGRVSAKSDMFFADAACGIAMLAREMAEQAQVYTFSSDLVLIPPRKGFALRDAIFGSQAHSSTYLGGAIDWINAKEPYDRLIVFTDEQSHDRVNNPKGKGYMVNVATNRNGVGYGKWVHIDGFSEATLAYIAEYERQER